MSILNTIVAKPSRNIIGLMSGTSCDGLDIALVKVHAAGKATRYEVINTAHSAYPGTIRKYLLEMMTGEKKNVAEISQANFFLARLWSQAINSFLKKTGLKPADIDLIGSHGQTVYHQPFATKMFNQKVSSTLQIGDPAVIAQLTGITTIGDFRVADVALGGQGAPLVPYFDWLVFAKLRENCLVLNIGGIANFTFVPADGDLNKVIAFDTGPGNMLIDQMMQRLYEKPFDRDGTIASQGKFSDKLFDYLKKSDTYPALSPPKSTGREHYGDEFVINLLRKAIRWRIMEPDVIHTVSRYTAYTVWQAYSNFLKTEIKKIYVGGGGAHNLFVRRMLQEYFKNVAVKSVSDAGINEDYKEAICFAILANECINEVPAGMQRVTGANASTILGKICLST